MKTRVLFAIASFVAASVLVFGQAAVPQEPRPVPDRQTPVTAIPGVIAAGTKVERIWTGNMSADGVIGEPNGNLLLIEPKAHRVSRMAPDGKVTPWLEDTNETGAMAIDAKGRYISVERLMPRVRELYPQRRILADTVEGKPIGRLSDIVVDRNGGVYITEQPNSVNYVSPQGQVTRVGPNIRGANGIMLSPDEKTLYVSNTEVGIYAFDVQPDGALQNRREFAKPEGGQDGLAIDSVGRLYIAADTGVQVYSPQGQHLGLIPAPRHLTSLGFVGPDKKTLYFVGTGYEGPRGGEADARSLYRVSMIAEGFKGRAK